jgi:hypothetical protein
LAPLILPQTFLHLFNQRFPSPALRCRALKIKDLG